VLTVLLVQHSAIVAFNIKFLRKIYVGSWELGCERSTIMQVILSQPVPSLSVSRAKQTSQS